MRPIDEIQQNTANDFKRTSSPSEKPAGMAPRWAVIIGMLAVGVLYAALPQRLRVGPSWLLLVIEAVFLIPLLVPRLVNRRLSHRTARTLILLLLGIITLALAVGIMFLISTLSVDKNAVGLLRDAALLWGFNILVFALWYWEIDGGGPLKRHQAGHQAADFMFPQQANGNDGSWVPHFFDYVFLAFTGATALSPADTRPLTRTAKALMMVEAILSMTIVVLLAARAVNILGS
jgi:uncharacterized membrane protein